MLNYFKFIEKNIHGLFFFTFSLGIITYGYALTNFILSIDNEIPILSNFGLDLGRWGQNLIRYHLFGGHLQYFSLILSVFLFSLSATRLAVFFNFKGYSAFLFCSLFITFPQISYQIVFGMMSDIAGLGVLLSVYFVELFIKALEIKSTKKKITFFILIAFIEVFTLSLYQVFIFLPIVIYILYFFKNTFKDSFELKLEIRKMLLFAGVILFSIFLYWVSIKIICPPLQQGYLSSYVSGETNNKFLNFCSIWLKNLCGGFYYGNQTFILLSILSLVLLVKFIIKKKLAIIRIITLIIIILLPFLTSYFITNGYHPPRLYLTTNIIYSFILIFSINYLKIDSYLSTKIAILLIVFVNFYFITNLFYTLNKIYKHDRKIAENIDYTIRTKYPKFSSYSDKYVYFFGYFPYEYHQKFRLQDSEIFGGSFFNWDNGNNYRIINFFREADVADYKMVDTKEKFDIIRDSIAKMPVWPDFESIKMYGKIIVVKIGTEKGMNVPGE